MGSSAMTATSTVLCGLGLIASMAQTEAADSYESNQAYANNQADGNHKFTVCADSYIIVEELSILCDSPGQYYYGGNKYRNSNQCMGGDKVKYEVQFDIPYDLPENVKPYLTMDVQGYGTVESVRLYDSVPLCEIDDLWSLDGSDCGQPGQFSVGGSFYFADQADDYDYKFKPKVVVGLSSQQNSNSYNLGGANTNQCDGESFTKWSNGIARSVSGPLHAFIVTMIVLALGALSVMSGLWYFNKYYRLHFEKDEDDDKQKKLNTTASDLVADDYIDEEDMKRIAMMGGRERDMIDA